MHKPSWSENILDTSKTWECVIPETGLPLLLDSPHSGTGFPDDFGLALPWAQVRQLEDSYVDELFAGSAMECGATWLKALCTRAYIDLNRNPADIDPLLVDGSYPGARPTRNCELGRGLIWRTLTSGEPLYARRLPVDEVRRRIEGVYRPYHREFVGQLKRLHRQFGAVWHLNCHSMPSVSGSNSLDGAAGVRRPDVVLGDGNGTACEPELTRFVRDAFHSMGYRVVENVPYKGAELTLAYSRPTLGFHSLQIELNRGLYMDEETREKHGGFPKLQRDLRLLVQQVAEFVRSRAANPQNQAAEYA
jgi:N-formylglutamate deformylase